MTIVSIEGKNSVCTAQIYTGDSYIANHDAEVAVNLASSLMVGQSLSSLWIKRGFLYFDTSVLPAGALIESARIKLHRTSDMSTTTKNFDIVIRRNTAGTYPSDPLVTSDFNYTFYTGDGGSLNTGDVVNHGFSYINLDATGISWINLIGITKFALISSEDISATPPEGTEFFQFDDGQGAYLEITYYTPTDIPTVGDPTFSDVGKASALATANVTDDGGGYEERGFEYGLTEIATWTKSETGIYSGTGDFSLTLSENITLPGTYYVRAYVKNSFGTGYSNWVKLEVVVYPDEGDWVAYVAYGEWVKFVTAAPGAAGGKPSGYKNDICSDYNGYTYILNRSLTDDGESYESYFVLSTDLSGGQTLHTNKRLLDIFTYFINKGSGTADIYVKRDTEAAWQPAGEVTMSGEQEIIIKHLPVDYLAKTYLFKFVFSNDFEFVGCILESVPIGDRP